MYNTNVSYFSILITVVSAIVMIVVSYLTPEPDHVRIKGLTLGAWSAVPEAHQAGCESRHCQRLPSNAEGSDE